MPQNSALSKAFNELFHAHKYGFHHRADCLVDKWRDGNHVIRFGQLQFELVMELNGVSIRLHVNYDVGIVRINLFGALGNQMPQQRGRILGHVHAGDFNGLGLALVLRF